MTPLVYKPLFGKISLHYPKRIQEIQVKMNCKLLI